MENPESLLVLLPLALVIFFPLLFCAVSWLISLVGGWSSLASHYGAAGARPQTPWQNWKSIAIRRTRWFPSQYGRIIKMAFDDDALYLSAFILLGIGHQTLRLPYGDMAYETRKQYFREFIQIRLVREPGIEVLLWGKDKARLLEKLLARA